MFEHLITISLVRCVETLQTENDSVAAAAALNYRAIIYVFAFMRAAVCCFCLLIIILTALMSSAM